MSERPTKLVLNTDDLTEEFFDDSRLLGIMAPVRGFQFCWHLNAVTGHDFRHNNEIQLTKKGRHYFFGIYEFTEPTGSLSHYVYHNQFDGEFLLPEFRHLDFLWLMKGDEVNDESLQGLIKNIRAIPGVQLVTELTHEKIKNKEHLIF
ncbi:MAG: IPExxxVDY family protein [Chitinophagaceae bacterium]|nr:IPExxxVDY family protein [Chitinophagaceae bacterium]MBL0153850.1 IPExxxVDY family protein [Chitinophagaceae bacterium]